MVLIITVLALSLLASAGLCLGMQAFSSYVWLWMLPVGFIGALLVIAGLLVLIVWLISQCVDFEKVQEDDSKFHRWLINVIATTAIPLLLVRPHTEGLEKIPKEGRFLLVSNHLDYMDPVTLVAFFKKSQLAFISKRENKKLFVVGKLMHKILCQPINRENDREALKTILRCVQILKEDKASIAVFPEGYISKERKLHTFRHGVFKIALKAKVPIVVCTLRNTHHIFHNAARLRPTHVHLHLLDVIPYEQIADKTTVEIGNRIYEMMAADLGPENVLQETETP